jgi:hypothetical protein
MRAGTQEDKGEAMKAKKANAIVVDAPEFRSEAEEANGGTGTRS